MNDRYSRVRHWAALDTGEHPSKRAALSVAACHLSVPLTEPPPRLLGASRMARLRIRPSGQDAAGFRFRVRTSPSSFPGQSLRLGRPGYCREPSLAWTQGCPATGPPRRKIPRVTQRRPTPSRRVRVLRMAPLHACLGIPQPATADRHWRAPPRGRVPWRATRAHVASPRRGPKGAPQ